MAGPLGPVWPPWGVACSVGRVAAVGTWLVLWVPCGRLGGVAGPLGPVWLPWGRGRSPGQGWLPWGRGRFPGPRLAVVGA